MDHKYHIIIGLEIHAQVKTQSKMFCCCISGEKDAKPNTNVCPICLAHPGTLPLPNKKAIEWTIMTGLATNCSIANQSKFDRKHYFYPDIPKGYQISQYDEPLCYDGTLHIDGRDIGIVRIHLEEDTAKLTHIDNASLVDFNRAGAPLMELVTAPTIETAEEAAAFCKGYQHILRTLGVSDANMELGEMRCEANISVQEKGTFEFTRTTLKAKGEVKLNNKVEVKNLNSFRAVERAIQHEVMWQIELIEAGEEILQETRGWNDDTETTVSQRTKESAQDYRYFPEPDIPPLVITEEQKEKIQRSIPELPEKKKARFEKEYGLSPQDARELTADKGISIFFENVVSEAGEWVQALKEQSEEVTDDEAKKLIKLAANWIQTEVFKHLKDNETSIEAVEFNAENFAELLIMLKDGKINSSAGQSILMVMFETGGDPSNIAERRNLLQESDEGAIKGIVDQVVQQNPDAVEDYKAGNERSMKFLMGQVMKESKGKANPQMAEEQIKEKIG